jgi:ABC-type Fe3+/spermidine/putrescine transport system ATPase subunit
MLDEPLGALDRALREILIEELRGILQRSGIPAIYVTHDQEEAFTIADKIILLHEGLVAQAGSPPQVFAQPANEWVASFLGLGNVVQGIVSEAGVSTSFGDIHWKTGRQAGQQVTILMRPSATLVETGGTLSGTVSEVVFRGDEFRVQLSNGLQFLLPTAPQPGEKVSIKVYHVELL